MPVKRFIREFDRDTLGLGIGMVGLQADFPADTALLKPSPRHCRIDVMVIIDPHNARIKGMGDAVGTGHVLSPDGDT